MPFLELQRGRCRQPESASTMLTGSPHGLSGMNMSRHPVIEANGVHDPESGARAEQVGPGQHAENFSMSGRRRTQRARPSTRSRKPRRSRRPVWNYGVGRVCERAERVP